MRFKLFLLVLPFLIFSNGVLSQNKLVVESENVANSSVFKLGISLENTDEISALQFDLSYNINEFDVLTGSELEDLRIGDHQLLTNPTEGVLRVVIFSMSNAVLKENSGILVNLEFKSKTNPGAFNFELSNVRASSATAQDISATIANGQITVLGSKMEIITDTLNFGSVVLGDNRSNSLVIRNGGNEPLVLTSATNISPFSIQEDFPITISANETYYLSVVLDSSIKQEVVKELSFTNNDVDLVRKNQKITLSAVVFATNTISLGNISAEKDVATEIPVLFENMEEFTGFQFDVLIPDGLEFVLNSIEKENSRFDGHDVQVNLNGNKLTFIGYSAANKNFIGSNGILFSFKLKPIVNTGYFNLNILDAIITNIAQEDILSNSYNGSFQINTPNLSISTIDLNFENIPLTLPQQKTITLSNTGSAVLVIDEVLLDASELTSDISLPLTISAYSSKDITLTYTPNIVGEFLESILFKSNGLNEESLVTVRGVVFSPNYVIVESKEVFAGETNILQILLKNNDASRGLQFEVELPTGFELKIDDLEITSRTDGYNVAAQKIEGSTSYTVILYSTTNKILEKGALSILNFPVFIMKSVSLGDYEFNFRNVIITNIENIDISSLSLESGQLTVLDAQLSIEDEKLEQSIQLYPNPVKDILSINSKAIVISKVAIYSVLGKKIKEVKSNFESIGIHNLSKGLYIIRIFSDKGSIIKRIIKR